MDETPLETEVGTVPVIATEQMPEPVPVAQQAFDPRRRIRELLTIPDRDRTDAEWDELNELEIQTAPGNRSGNAPFAPYNPKPGGMQSKNRNKGKGGPRKPGGGKPFLGKPNNKPRPA